MSIYRHAFTLVSGATGAALLAALLCPVGPAAASAGRLAPPASAGRLSGAAAPPGNNNLYVDDAFGVTCSDSGTGTQAQPFCTIGAAAATVQPGQTVVVEAGEYAGTTISASGTASSPITFFAANGPAGYVKVDSGFVVSGVHDVTLSGFNVVAGQPFLVDNSSGITLSGGSATATSQDPDALPAVQVTGTSSDVTISRMSIAAFSTEVQIDQGVTGAVVTTNTITVNTGPGVPADPGPGVLVTDAPGTDVVSNTLVTNCHTGVVVTGTSPGATLENNIAETATLPVNNPTSCAEPAGAIGLSVSADSTPQTVADYNLIDPVSAGPLYSWGGTSYTSLTSFTAASGQGTHDIAADPDLSQLGNPGDAQLLFLLGDNSPAINSADANAPGELQTDEFGDAWADDPSVPNTGTGPGFYARGAVALDNGISYGNTTSQPDSAGGPLDVTLSHSITSSWTTSGPIGTYEYVFSDGSLPVVTSASSINHTFSAAGKNGVLVYAGVEGFYNFANDDSTVIVGADYTPVTPTRILDTRSGIGAPKGAVAPHGDLTLAIPAIGQVGAADMSGIAVNVTVTGPTAGGELTVTQAGASASTSNINFTTGQTIANLVTVQPIGGAISFQNNSGGTLQVVADLDGYYSNSGVGFQGTAPVRVLDTRSKIGITTSGPVASHGTVRLNLSGQVPVGAAAAVLNLTVTQPTSGGFITAYPDGQPLPGTSSLNFVAGQTIPNQVIVPLTNDMADFYNGSPGTVQLIGDLAGYFSTGATGSFVPYGPTRIADTRNGTGTGVTAAAVPAHGTLLIDTDTFADCEPDDCPLDTADVLNVAVTQPQAGGFLTVYPHGQELPDSSSINFTAGQTIANLVTTQNLDSGGGEIAIYNGSSGSVQIFVDEQGYFINQP